MDCLSKKQRRRGQAMIEFVLVSAFFWIPLITAITTTGFRFIRSVELLQLVNDTSQMWARGVDFSTSGNQTVLTGTMASPFGMQGNGANTVTGGTTGDLVIVMSQYFWVNPSDPSCVNLGSPCTSIGNGKSPGNYVLERRIIVGNKNIIGANGAPSSIGTIPSNYLNNTTGTCEPGDNNLPPPPFGTGNPTTCQYTVTAIQVAASSFNTIMTNLPHNSGGNVGGTVYLVEGYYTDLFGRLSYQRSLD